MTFKISICYCSVEISTHTPVRVWRSALRFHQGQGDFNSHTREGVTSGFTLAVNAGMISTHTPVRVWRQSQMPVLWKEKFQLTHPWGCDVRQCKCYNTQVISTHTPVRVWRYFLHLYTHKQHFNSHTREGVTISKPFCRWTLTFQLTHPWGCDTSFRHLIILIPISTHTPVRVWLIGNVFKSMLTISTHTPVRVWPLDCLELIIAQISTHTPVRVWQIVFYGHLGFYHFNSHTREGVTCDGNPLYHQHCISTHTPVRVWLCCANSSSFCPYFNSHTREGVTWYECTAANSVANFNSHTREGVTLCYYCDTSVGKFQLTHPWGCDIILFILNHLSKFQLTHPWGCDIFMR